MTSRKVRIASLGLALAATTACDASFTYYSNVNSWRNAVGGPTIQRNPSDYFDSVGEIVDPEIWADVGVHLVSSGPLESDFASGIGYLIASTPGNNFEVRWDAPITALWFRVQAPTGVVSLWSGDTFIPPVVGDGQIGLISTIAFDRMVISFPNASNYGFLFNLEWAPVPAPGALPLFGGGLLAVRGRRRR